MPESPEVGSATRTVQLGGFPAAGASRRSWDFVSVERPQDHFARRRSMLKAHPELKELGGAYRPTVLVFPLLVLSQLALAFVARDLPVWAMLLVAYGVGAILSHALFIMIHEVTHDLVLRRPTSNRLLGIFANLPTVLPSAMAFRKYHLLHHRRMGEVEFDADLPSAWERWLVRGNPVAKAIWLLFFPVFQALRPFRMGRVPVWDGWNLANIAIVLAVDVAIVVFLGWQALIYLALSTLFGLGLHPLGARWIQEHFITEPDQETYSCYSGLGNRLAFNVGHHVEHHDFMNVPWVNLPRIRQIAPEYYDPLASYDSWTALLFRFLRDPKLCAASRIARDEPSAPATSETSSSGA